MIDRLKENWDAIKDTLKENYDMQPRLDESQTAHWEKMCTKWDKRADELMKDWEKQKGANNEKG